MILAHIRKSLGDSVQNDKAHSMVTLDSFLRKTTHFL